MSNRRSARLSALFLVPVATLFAGTMSCTIRSARVRPVVAVPVHVPHRQVQPPPPAPGPARMDMGPIQAGCTFRGNQLRGELGAMFNVMCPAGCDQPSTRTHGYDTYSDVSPICKSAIHAGAIPPAGGPVVVRLDPGRLAYRGSVHYGIRSYDAGRARGSFTILFAEGQQRLPEAAPIQAPTVVEAGCTFTGNHLRGEPGTTATVSCPTGCATSRRRFWGTEVYTGNSPICAAAIHAGLIPAHGGTVIVTLDPGRPAYRGSARNGLTSYDHGSYRSSFRMRRP